MNNTQGQHQQQQQQHNMVSFPATPPVEHDRCPVCGALNGPFERLGTGICNACLDKRIAQEREAERRTQREAQRRFETRSLELARAHGLIGSAIYRDTSPLRDTIELFSVRSISSGSIYIGRHTVEHDLLNGKITCDCKAGQHGRPCGHAGSVLRYLQERAGLLGQLMREAAAAAAAEATAVAAIPGPGLMFL